MKWHWKSLLNSKALVETAHLKAFLRIAETGSISRAAESLGIAQPSLSQQLLRLEDEVGTRLFDRTARGVTLTIAGRVFREGAHQVLHAAEQVLADTRELRDEAQGNVVLAMPPSLAQIMGSQLVKELAVTAPQVRVRVVEAFSGSTRGWIESEKIDLGIVYETGPLRHLITTGLASDELVIIGGRSRLGDENCPEKLSLKAFTGESWIVPGRQHGLRQVFDAECARLGLNLTVAHEVDSIAATIDLVASGYGLALMPYCATLDSRWAGQVKAMRIGTAGLWRRLSLIRNPAHVLTHASVRVTSAVRNVAARMIAEGAWQARLEGE